MIHFNYQSQLKLMATFSNLLSKILNISLFLVAFMLFNLNLSAQPGSIEWEHNYGGSEGETANDIQTTDDGGYIVAGQSDSADGDVSENNGDDDYWIVKLDGSGNIEWEGNYGGSARERAYSVQQTDDGGYIVAGDSESDDVDVSGNNGEYDYWVIKLDSTGNIEWEENYGGSDFDRAESIQQTSDGGYIVCGESNSDDGDVSDNNGEDDYWVLKLGSSGIIEWEENYGGSYTDNANSILQTDDGGYIVSGYTNNSGSDLDYLVIKLDNSGGIEWDKNYGGSDNDGATSIQATNDGGYIVAGGSTSSDGDVSFNYGGADYWIVKLNSSGVIEWENSYGGNFRDEPQSIQQTTDGGYIIAGGSMSDDGNVSSNNGLEDYWVVKIDGSGNIEWEETYGGIAFDTPDSVKQTDDGGYIVAGNSLSADGDVGGNQGTVDMWIVKIEGSGTMGTSNDVLDSDLKIYPNPTRKNITVENIGSQEPQNAILRDISGRMISQQEIDNPSSFQIKLEQETGIYIIELKYANGNRTFQKVLKE